MPKKTAKAKQMTAQEEVALLNRNHGASKAMPGEWKIGKEGRHLYFWPDTDEGIQAAEDRGLLVDVVVLRAGDELPQEVAEATIRRAHASPAMEAVLLELLKYWDAGTPVHPGAEIIDDVRAALKASGALK